MAGGGVVGVRANYSNHFPGASCSESDSACRLIADTCSRRNPNDDNCSRRNPRASRGDQVPAALAPAPPGGAGASGEHRRACLRRRLPGERPTPRAESELFLVQPLPRFTTALVQRRPA